MIFEEDEENVSATYEWKKEGVPSTIDKLQKIPREKAKALYQGFVPSEVTIINDTERMNKALKDGNISAVKINSLVSGHLAINRKSFGFVEVVNPAPDRLKDASLLLTAVTRFLSVLIRNRDIYKRLRQLGNTDQLTGVMNRHRFMGLMQHIPQGEPIALICADFNDLKDINDTDGHEAGDEALRKMACTMCSVVDQNRVFRVGGDEFIAVAEEVNLDDVKEIVKKMRQAFDEQGVSAALGYGIFKMPIDGHRSRHRRSRPLDVLRQTPRQRRTAQRPGLHPRPPAGKNRRTEGRRKRKPRTVKGEKDKTFTTGGRRSFISSKR